MKGNKLIATSIASAMLVAGMAMPALAVDSATEVRYSEKYVSSPAIAIDLRNGESELTRDKLATLVSDRYHTTLVNVQNTDGVAVTAGSARVGTGYIATLGNGKTVTVVLYGDINKDGAVDLVDAQAIYNNYHVTSLPAEQAKAAELTGDSTIDFVDAQRAFNYASPAGYTGLVADLDRLPAEEDMTVNSNFTVTVAEDNIVNNVEQEEGNVELKVVPKVALKEGEVKSSLYLKLIKPDGTSEEYQFGSDDKLRANRTEYTLSLPVSDSTHNYLTQNGTYSATLGAFYGTDKETDLVSFSFQVLAEAPVSANATTTRPYTYEARMSLDAYSVYGTVNKVYYSKDSADLENAEIDKENSKAKSLPLSGNRLDNEVIFNSSADLTAYTSGVVYYVVEDVYGNRSGVYGPITITTDGPLTDNVDVYKVTLDDFTKKTFADAQFAWTVGEDGTTNALNRTYEIVLYKDGYPIATEKLTPTGSADRHIKDLFRGHTDLEAGDYQVTVRTLGNGRTPDSTVIARSEVRTVSKLSPVSNVTLSQDEDGKDIVVWESAYENNKTAISGYTVELGVYDISTGKTTWNASSLVNDTDKKDLQAQVTLVAGTIYKARVTVNDTDNPNTLDTVDSDSVESSAFFKLDASGISILPDLTTSSSVTLNLSGAVLKTQIKGKTTTYSVEVYKVNDSKEAGMAEAKYLYQKTVSVTLDASNHVVVNGLEPNTEYAFKVVADIEGIKGVSGYVVGVGSKTKKAMPSLSGLTVVAPVDSAEKVGYNEVAVDKTVSNQFVYINGEKYESLAEYGEDLEAVYTLIRSNTLREGDVFTYTPDKLTVTLGNRSTAEATREFNDVAKVKTLELTGDGSKREITTDVDNLVLSGNGALFGITGVTSEKVTLNDGVTVTDAKIVTVVAGANVSVNGYGVSPSANTKLELDGSSINVTPNDGTNDLTFNTGDNDLTLTFVGDASKPFHNTQDGRVTINSTSGAIKVLGSNMNVASDINVVMSGSGSLDLSDVTLDGAQSVTVSGKVVTPGLKLKADKVAPIAFDELKLLEYTTDDVAEVDGATAENMEAVIEYLNSFGLNGTGAKLSVSAKGNIVTITDLNSTAAKVVGNLTHGE